MRTSRAAILVEVGRPAPYARSRPIEVDEIELDDPQHGEVVVKLASAGLCHSDLSTVEGTLLKSAPLVIGHEAAGVVVECGAGVTRVASGDHVVFSFVPSCGACERCQAGRPALCAEALRANLEGVLLRNGRRLRRGGSVLHHHLGVSGFAEYTVCAQESLVPIPASVPLEIASMFGCAALTGLGAVLNTARVSPGSSAAIFGAGGVGLMVLLGCVLAGAAPIVVVDPVASKRELARSLGATHVVDPSAADGARQVRELLGGLGANYAFECAGRTAALESAVMAAGIGSTIVAVGLPAADARAALSQATFVLHEKTLKGSFMGSAVPIRDIPLFLRLWAAGKLPVERLISRTIRLDDLNESLDLLAAGEVVRSVCAFEPAPARV